MIIHNLKIALRNMAKYKLQTLVSIVALAVGIVTLAATHFVLGFVQEPAILDEPYADRCYFVRLDKITTEKENNRKKVSTLVGVAITQEINDALTANGGLTSVEQMVLSPFMNMNSDFIFTATDSTQKSLSTEVCIISPEYLNFRAIRSAITGEIIPVLRNNEIVLSEYEAKLIFGDKNPVGSQVWVGLMNDMFDYNNTYTVRDVYKVESTMEKFTPYVLIPLDKDAGYYRHNFGNVGHKYEVKLREGYTIEQFIEEANSKIKSYGVEVGTYSHSFYYKIVYPHTYLIRTIVYIISSLVLLASLIGFLKMQLQLLNMRRREIALRKVHGASTNSLFTLFFVEVTIVLFLSSATAFFISEWITEYIEYHLTDLLNKYGIIIEGVEISLFGIIIPVIIICVVSIWITLNRIIKTRNGVASELHRKSKHVVRNTMLAIQIIVGLLFLSGTMLLVELVGCAKEKMNVPANDDYYKKCLTIEQTANIGNDGPQKLREYLYTGAKGVKRSFSYLISFNGVSEIEKRPELRVINKLGFIKIYYVDKENFLDFWQLSIKWIKPELKGGHYLLVKEDLYNLFVNERVFTDNSLQIEGIPSLPVAGTYSDIPYDDNKFSIIMIKNSPLTYVMTQLVIEPEEGEYANVLDDVKKEIMRINPTAVSPDINSLRDEVAKEINIFENMERGAWILSFVSFAICIMGIYSSISLDTRSRMKEVAVRKVHGAKRRDIVLLFGRLYLWLFGVAAVVTLPLIILFGDILNRWAAYMIPDDKALSPLIAFAVGLLVTMLVVVMIVGYHIRMVMRLNLSDIIVKE